MFIFMNQHINNSLEYIKESRSIDVVRNVNQFIGVFNRYGRIVGVSNTNELVDDRKPTFSI